MTVSSEWKKTPLSPISTRPEADWLINVRGTDKPLVFSLLLPVASAAALFEALKKAYVDEGNGLQAFPASDSDVNDWSGFLSQYHGMMVQMTFARLYRFLEAHLDENQEFPNGITITVELQAKTDSVIAMQSLLNGQAGANIVDVVPTPYTLDFDGYFLVDPSEDPILEETVFSDSSVITVVIDDGMGIANHRFRLSEKTSRIAWFLDMNQAPTAGATADPGRSFSKAEIDALLVQSGTDETQFYRDAGMLQCEIDKRKPLGYRGTHGTHVLDLAAGEDYRDPLVQEGLLSRPIIIVQLPSDVVEDRSDARMAITLKTAFAWISEKAQALSKSAAQTQLPNQYLPVVVNFSFGVIAGPHDGTGNVEKQIVDFIRDYRALEGEPDCDVVLAAGNSFQARAIAHHQFTDDEPEKEFTWRVKPDDRTPSFVQIWLPPSSDLDVQKIKVGLIPPRAGPATVEMTELGETLDWMYDGHVLARLYHQMVPGEDGTARERITIAIHPTETEDGKSLVCPHGAWKIRLENISVSEQEEISLQVQRDDPVAYVRSKGRQSYFDDADYVRFDDVTGRLINDGQKDTGSVSRRRTLSAYATGPEPVVLAGYRQSDGTPAFYSSSGPTFGERQGPDLAAICEVSAAHGGVLASGTYTGSVVALNGTSVAAPQYTRYRVSEIAKNAVGAIPNPPAHYPAIDPERLGQYRLLQTSDNPYRKRVED